MPRPRALLVSHGLPPAQVGGVEVVTWRFARQLAAGGVQTAVLHPDSSADTPPGILERSRVEGVVRYRLGVPRGPDSGHAAVPAFSRVLALWEPDVVWIHHLSRLSLELPRIALAEGLALAITLHDYWWMCPRGQLLDADGRSCPGPAPDRCPACLAPGAPPPARPAVRWLAGLGWRDRQRRSRQALNRAAVRTAPTRHVAERHASWSGGDVEVFGNPPPSLRPVPLPPPAGPLRLGYFGTLLPSKGIETLLRAHARLPHGAATLQLHGPLPHGDEWRDWRQQVRALAARTGAQLCGPYPPAEVEERLAEVEVVCLPSIWEENAPVVLDEALAARRAVIASDIGGIPERVGPTAVLVPAGDERAWTAVLGDTARLRALCRRSPGITPARPDPEELLHRAIRQSSSSRRRR